MIVALSAGREAPAELRERLALDDESTRELLRRRGGIRELVALGTCHRTELYATAEDEATSIHALAALLPSMRPSDHRDVRLLRGREAIEHLCRVACGLDSLVVGEPQVLSQVRKAYALAREANAAGPILSSIFSRALSLGRRAREPHLLGAASASLGSATAEHLGRRLGGLANRRGAIVGAGAAACDAAQAIARSGARLTIVGRSHDRTRTLADSVGGEAEPLDRISVVLGDADFAVVAVAGGRLVEAHHIPARSDPLPVVDLSVPRSVHVNGRRDVEVTTVHALPRAGGASDRTVATVEAMIATTVDDLVRRALEPDAGRAAGALRAHAARIVDNELERSLSALGLDPEQERRVAAMAQRIANKLVHGGAVACRDGDEHTRSTVRAIFGLDP